MLDTGATHCFICAQLANLLHLSASSAQGPMAVSLATAGPACCCLAGLVLGAAEPLREVITISPLDLGPELYIILGWDSISCHDLRFLYPPGGEAGGGSHGPISAPLRPSAGPPATRGAVLTGNSGVCCGVWSAPADFNEPQPLLPASLPDRRDARAACRSPVTRSGRRSSPRSTANASCGGLAGARGLPPPHRSRDLWMAWNFPPTAGSFTSRRCGSPTLLSPQSRVCRRPRGPPPCLPPGRGIELVVETGNLPMPRTRPIKRWELAELRRQLTCLLARGWIQHSAAGHAPSVVFARKPDGSWRICYDYLGLNAITEPLVEPLPHIGALLDETRGACWFTKFDLAQGYHQVRLREAGWWKTSFRSQLGQFEWKMMPLACRARPRSSCAL